MKCWVVPELLTTQFVVPIDEIIRDSVAIKLVVKDRDEGCVFEANR